MNATDLVEKLDGLFPGNIAGDVGVDLMRMSSVLSESDFRQYIEACREIRKAKRVQRA